MLLVSLVPQFEFQYICYEGNGKSCSGNNVYTRCGGGFVSSGGEKA